MGWRNTSEGQPSSAFNKTCLYWFAIGPLNNSHIISFVPLYSDKTSNNGDLLGVGQATNKSAFQEQERKGKKLGNDFHEIYWLVIVMQVFS